MISITYTLNIDEKNLEDLPPGGVDVLSRITTDTLSAAMEPIKQGILDGTIFLPKAGIKSTGKLRKQCVIAGRS